MNKNFLYFTQRLCTIPAAIQSNLYEKIKKSDFLVADDKGIHRLIGLKYCVETDSAPIVTCICMRHEMAYAKQIAFSLGKKIFYHSNFSAKLFASSEGNAILSDNFSAAVDLYIAYLHEINRNKDAFNNIIRVSRFGVKIHGHLLKPFFRLKDLIMIIGKPDEREWFDSEEKSMEICSWNKIGLRTYSEFWDKNHIKGVFICKKEIPGKKIQPFWGELFINEELFEEKETDGIYENIIAGKNAIIVAARKDEKCKLCSKYEADFIAIDFYKKINLTVLCNQEKSLLKLIKEGHNINSKIGFNQEPLLTVAITENFPDIVKILIDAGADLNEPNRWGITPLMRAIILKKLEFVKLLIDKGADKKMRDKDGFSALDYARMHELPSDIMEILEFSENA